MKRKQIDERGKKSHHQSTLVIIELNTQYNILNEFLKLISFDKRVNNTEAWSSDIFFGGSLSILYILLI